MLCNFKTAKEIKRVDRSNSIIIKTGLKLIDETIQGLDLGQVSIVSGSNGCVDCDTEFFNGYQWKKISEWNKDDKVLQFNNDGTATLVYPQQYIKLKCDKLTLVKDQYGSLNQCLSDEHRFVYKSHRDNINIKPFKEIKDNFINNGKISGNVIPFFSYVGSGINMSANEIRLMIAICADGNFPQNTTYCRVNLKKQYKKDRLEYLLNSLGIDYKKKKYNPKDEMYDAYIFYAPFRFKQFPYEWLNMNKAQKDIFIDEIFKWDGVIDSCGRKIFRCTNKMNIDIAQFIMASQGYKTSINIDNRPNRKCPCYYLYLHKNKYVSLNVNKKISMEEYYTKDGFKYCFTVDSGMLVLRRNGAINITGNSAKSTVLNQIALNVIEQGYSVGIFSGELSDWRLMNWLYLQCAGPKNVRKATNKAGEELNFYTVSDYNKDKVDEWIGDRLYVYDNDGGVGIDKVGNSIQELVKTDRRVKFIILDNLMSLNIQKYGADKYEAQKETILRLCNFAKLNNVHIIFVCHPRKSTDFIRKEDISGSGDLANAVDNIFICHRNTQDFKKRSKEFFGWHDEHPIYQYDNIIEIAKNRELGCIEKLCGFYFDTTCKRFLNYQGECHRYGWETNYKQQELTEITDGLDELPF